MVAAAGSSLRYPSLRTVRRTLALGPGWGGGGVDLEWGSKPVWSEEGIYTRISSEGRFVRFISMSQVSHCRRDLQI